MTSPVVGRLDHLDRADVGDKLAKWLDFQFGGPQVGNQVRALTAEIRRLQTAVQETDAALAEVERRLRDDAAKLREEPDANTPNALSWINCTLMDAQTVARYRAERAALAGDGS